MIPRTPLRARAQTPAMVAQAQAAGRRAGGFAATLAMTIYWLLVTRVIIPGFFDYGPGSNKYQASGNAELSSKAAWLLAFSVSAVMVLSRMGGALRLLRAASPFFLLLVLDALVSVVWSIDPIFTVARTFRLVTVILVCSALILTGWNDRRFQQATRPIFTIILVASLIFGLLAPDLALDLPAPGDTSRLPWHGLADQKNQFGALASMGVILWFHGWAAREVKTLSALLWGGAAAACLVLSRSSTSLLATALVCLFLLVLLRSSRGARRLMPMVIGIFVVVTLTYTLAVLNVVPGLDALLTPVADLAGKDRTFSNRAHIWEIIRAHVRQSPFLGTGYGAYWVGPVPSSPSYIFLPEMFFYPGECHNGYLEIINDLGALGLVLLIGYLWNFLRQCLRLLRSNYSQAGLYLAMLFQQLLTNLSESHWLFIQSDCLMLTLATLCLARHSLDRGARPAG
jgi:O-antigen ligase